MTEERKDAIGLLAEKVMELPGMKDVTRDFLFSIWNPFKNAKHAVELMEALRDNFGIGFRIEFDAVDLQGHRGCKGYRCVPCGFVGWGNHTYTDGLNFAETLTTAIHRLVVERPGLFAERP